MPRPEATRGMRVILAMFAWAFAGCMAFVLAWLWMPAVGSVSPEALQYSIAAKTGGGIPFVGFETCRRTHRGWRCQIPDSGNSGSWRYAVERNGYRCWEARLIADGGEGVAPRRASGCVELRHQLRIGARLLGE